LLTQTKIKEETTLSAAQKKGNKARKFGLLKKDV
jgi:hypothetical protein